mmetsp:Transcript_11091/g.36794  ORF Transcript_11091/g.36794 Transcript_11091/m.36794 type:complete len:101 (-) Transcript_11091:472-774(-)|eukprot:scaffold6290_cov125-Isochrysis_galbana.AAC.1
MAGTSLGDSSKDEEYSRPARLAPGEMLHSSRRAWEGLDVSDEASSMSGTSDRDTLVECAGKDAKLGRGQLAGLLGRLVERNGVPLKLVATAIPCAASLSR